MEEKSIKLFGLYRATVIYNHDPLNTNRLKVVVPAIDLTEWALSCLPFSNVNQSALPEVGGQRMD
jgi:hypothetical protein